MVRALGLGMKHQDAALLFLFFFFFQRSFNMRTLNKTKMPISTGIQVRPFFGPGLCSQHQNSTWHIVGPQEISVE